MLITVPQENFELRGDRPPLPFKIFNKKRILRRIVFFGFVSVYSPCVAQVTVASDIPVNGKILDVAEIAPDGTWCRAPFGVDTIFHVDKTGRLLVVQRDLRRVAEVSRAQIGFYSAARREALQRVTSVRSTLMSSTAVSPQFKARLVQYGRPPSPQIKAKLLRAPSNVTQDSRVEPDLARLERALLTARQEIATAGLSQTSLGFLSTCTFDVSQLPVTVTNQKTGETRRFERRSGSPDPNKFVQSDYKLVSLYELMESFGQPLSMEQPQ